MNILFLWKSFSGALDEKDIEARVTRSLTASLPDLFLKGDRKVFVSRDVRLFALILSSEGYLVEDSDESLSWASGNIGSDQQSFKSKILYALQRKNLDAIAESEGVFACSGIRLSDATGFVYTTITRLEPVFYTTIGTSLIVCNRLLPLAFCRYGTSPEFDPIGIAQFINHGYYLGERTPFADIRCLEPDSALELVADDFRIRRLSGTCGIQRFSLSSRRAREISEVLVSSAAAMRDRSINLGLTGGKDSRLMAAILSKAGVPFKSSTVGEPSDPDVIYAKQVADALRIPHEVKPRSVKRTDGRVSVNILSRIRNTILATEGMMSARENISYGTTLNNTDAMASGAGGELYRGGFAKNLSSPQHSAILGYIRRINTVFNKYLSADIASRVEQEAQSIYGQLAERNRRNPVSSILDDYYLLYRAGRWSSAGYSAGRLWRRFFFVPLFDNKAVKLSRDIPLEHRVNERLVHDILRELSPGLEQIPFANDTWKFQGHVRAVAPAPHARPTTPDWRYTILTDLRDDFHQLILEDRDHQADLVCDMRRIRDLLEGRDEFARQRACIDSIWALATVCMVTNRRFYRSLYDAVQEQTPLDVRLSNIQDATEGPGTRSLPLALAARELLDTQPPTGLFISSRFVDLSESLSLAQVPGGVRIRRVRSTDVNLYVSDLAGPWALIPQADATRLLMQGSSVFEFGVTTPSDDNIQFYVKEYDGSKLLNSSSYKVSTEPSREKVTLTHQWHPNATSFRLFFNLNCLRRQSELTLSDIRIRPAS